MSSISSAIADQEASVPEMPAEMKSAFERWRQEYHVHMGELASKGMQRKAAAGILPCCAPVGYRNYQKKIEVDPVLAPLVREAFERAATSRLPLRALLAEMTAKGLISRSGKELKVSAFWYMLRNPFYVGLIRWHGELIQGTHKALINQEGFQAVQHRLDAKQTAA